MTTNWITGTLTDLQDFAKGNGLPELAAQLALSLRIAECELAEKRTVEANLITLSPNLTAPVFKSVR